MDGSGTNLPKQKSTPFGRPAATLATDGPAEVKALAPLNNLLADKLIHEYTAYERQLSLRVKSETKDGQLVLHQTEEQMVVKINVKVADRTVLQSLTLELFSPIDVSLVFKLRCSSTSLPRLIRWISVSSKMKENSALTMRISKGISSTCSTRPPREPSLSTSES